MEKLIRPIAYIETDFKEKFGIPRQPLLVKGLTGRIIFEPEYRHPDALKGIEQFSHLWLIWDFSENDNTIFHATVKPPRLGGKTHVGVFASRSPFRPNGMGLSVVRLVKVEQTEENGQVLVVEGADMLDGTPIYDIKPYIPLVDCQREAVDGYTAETRKISLEVECPEEVWTVREPDMDGNLPKPCEKSEEEHRTEIVPLEKRQQIIEILSQDPRPRYGVDSDREYGMFFDKWNVKFVVKDGKVTVTKVESNKYE